MAKNQVFAKQNMAVFPYFLYRGPNKRYNKKLLGAQRDAMTASFFQVNGMLSGRGLRHVSDVLNRVRRPKLLQPSAFSLSTKFRAFS